ncbi:TrpB-like pyridoxal phosphate-dependent enzyme [Candidatus Formimonas warabiya]|uniref:Tryptophan synthase beta chain n=1 Tax=Formimonas warabiya TaxID=1761012 RepID=A0A3G1KPM1_FORW1|nr:TrpB-like pyridoxal phosphate-dependent enzyme [Candidatus Formimonas warabiya]ATW24085.1 TrpB-like pyridoxal-phosphate dependent enzyme [Candidatus Formimonas warabiya]
MSKLRDPKVILSAEEMPTQWYNIMADMPNLPAPGINPGTLEPLGPEALQAIFPMELIKQEVTQERFVEIPDEVQELYRLWRPAPLMRAYRLEKALDTPAKIFYKYEGTNPTGSHKLNTSIPQAYYNKQAGIKRLATETGAGQWGSALSLACSFFGLECMVYMVKVSYHQKPYRRSFMELFGAQVAASPSNLTEAGRRALEEDPDSLGSLGLAISEAVEDAASRDDTNYALGSVLNHVILHQTVIGLESKKQLEKVDEYPDVVIGCCGGGSNFSGISFPFLADKFGGRKIRAVAVEPAACPTLTKGVFAYDFGDTAKLTPILKMYTLGHDFMPPGIHAGGLRYHGASPLVSQLYHDGTIETVAYTQNEVFEAAVTFARTEGIVPAPESAHAVKGAFAEALAAKEAGEERTILFSLSGHGYFDFASYDAYLGGKLEDIAYSSASVQESLKKLPSIK